MAKKIKKAKKLKTDFFFVMTGDLLLEEREKKTDKLVHSEKLDDRVKAHLLDVLIKELECCLEEWIANVVDTNKKQSKK